MSQASRLAPLWPTFHTTAHVVKPESKSTCSPLAQSCQQSWCPEVEVVTQWGYRPNSAFWVNHGHWHGLGPIRLVGFPLFQIWISHQHSQIKTVVYRDVDHGFLCTMGGSGTISLVFSPGNNWPEYWLACEVTQVCSYLPQSLPSLLPLGQCIDSYHLPGPGIHVHKQASRTHGPLQPGLDSLLLPCLCAVALRWWALPRMQPAFAPLQCPLPFGQSAEPYGCFKSQFRHHLLLHEAFPDAHSWKRISLFPSCLYFSNLWYWHDLLVLLPP